MAKQLVRMFKILLLSTNVFTVHGKVSDLLFLKTKQNKKNFLFPITLQEEHRMRKKEEKESYTYYVNWSQCWVHVLVPLLINSATLAIYFLSQRLSFSHWLHIWIQQSVLSMWLGLLWGRNKEYGTCWASQMCVCCMFCWMILVLSLCCTEWHLHVVSTFMKVSKSCGEISLGNNKLKNIETIYWL